MPIARVRLENGRIAKFNVPEGSTQQDVMDYVANNPNLFQPKQQEEAGTPKGNLLSAKALQGATFGFGDEAVAGLEALGAKALGGEESLSDYYKLGLEKEKVKLAEAEQKYPKQALAAELGGSLLSGGAVLKGAGLLEPTFKAGAKGGALLSGLQTAGENKDISNLPKELAVNVPIGAALGGTLQKVIPPAIGGVGKLAQKGGEALGIIKKTSPAERYLTKNISPEQAKSGLETLQKSQLPETAAIDLDNPEIRSVLNTAIEKSPQAKQIASDFAAGRKEQALTRIQNSLSKDISPVENAFKSIDDIKNARALATSPLYEKAYSSKVIKRDIVEPLVSDKRVVKAITKAREDFGVPENVPYNSVQSLHGARQVIDDIINAAKSAEENNKARAYSELRNKITDVLHKASPELKQADNIFASESRLISATEQGQDFAKKNAYEIAKDLKGFSQAEKEAYRVGVRQSMQDTIEKAVKESGSSKPAEALINKEYSKAQIKAVFGNEEKANNFIKKLSEEIKFNETQKALGLGKINIEQATPRELMQLIGEGARAGATGYQGGLVLKGTTFIEKALIKRYRGLNENVAKDITRIFTDRQKSEQILKKIANYKNSTQKQLALDIINELAPVAASDITINKEQTINKFLQ